jgi:hypothetical protein
MILQIITSTARNIAGIALIVTGLVLWLLPIIPGGLIMIPGIIMLSFPGKTKFFKRLEKTALVSKLMVKNETFRQIWVRLYTSPETSSPK